MDNVRIIALNFNDITIKAQLFLQLFEENIPPPYAIVYLVSHLKRMGGEQQ